MITDNVVSDAPIQGAATTLRFGREFGHDRYRQLGLADAARSG
jgi:hypothetical protein